MSVLNKNTEVITNLKHLLRESTHDVLRGGISWVSPIQTAITFMSSDVDL